ETIEDNRFTSTDPIRSMVPVWLIARCSRNKMLDAHNGHPSPARRASIRPDSHAPSEPDGPSSTPASFPSAHGPPAGQ
ncbi:MAG: hypothetical protein ACKOAH_08005, partial [Pirellula sp.]